MKKIFSALAVASLLCANGWAQAPATTGLDAIPEIPLSQIQGITALGNSALSMNPSQWKHGESKHFYIHFRQSFLATSVSVEAEFYYRFVTADLGITPTETQKSHIYVFENDQEWNQFRAMAALEEWTGAITTGNSLFVVRNPAFKFKGHSLGHEVVHLVIRKYLGTMLPLWLEEGYAEELSVRAYAAYYRARGFMAKPWAHGIPDNQFIPLSQLFSLASYPGANQVETFYDESHSLVSFLEKQDKGKFVKLITATARGTSFDSALHDSFGLHWVSTSDMEKEFKTALAGSAN